MKRFFSLSYRGVGSSMVCVLFGVAGIGCAVTPGSGILKSQERYVTTFHEIEASGELDLEVVQGSPQRVEVSTDDNLLSSVETDVHDDRLTIDTRGRLDPSGPIRVRIITPSVREVWLNGSSGAVIKRVVGQDFRLEASGSSRVNIEAMKLAGRLTIETHGSSSIRAQGESRELAIGSSGSSPIDTRELGAASVVIDSSGSSDLLVFAKDALTLDLRGSSSVGYLGEPKLKATVSGSGKIRRL